MTDLEELIKCFNKLGIDHTARKAPNGHYVVFLGTTKLLRTADVLSIMLQADNLYFEFDDEQELCAYPVTDTGT